MTNEFDGIEKKLKNADADSPQLSPNILDEATRASKRSASNPNTTRFAITSVAGIAAVTLFASLIPSADQPLFVLAADNSPDQLSQDSSMSEGSIASDSLPAWLNQFNYTASESLSDQTGEGAVYELVLNGTPSKRLEEFAAVFDQQGNVELEEWSTEYFPSYKLETEDAYFSLYWHGSGIINYSSKRNWLPEECYLTDDELEGVERDTTPSSGCEPLPTVEMPSEEILTQEAFEIISNAGYQGNLEDIEIKRYQWGAEAFASTSVSGDTTAIEWYLSWDQTGQISNVSGHLARAINVGMFNTISPKEAVSRIDQGYWFGAPARIFYAESNLQSVSSSVESDLSSSSAMQAPEDIDKNSDDVEMLPVEPLPGPDAETTEIMIESSVEATLLIEDSKGTGWLVPGHLLQTNKGWFESIVSLEDGVVGSPE
ncbi:MAG: hypothetical protein RI530_02315 [Microbacteriaceae bacterium]|nr:hypothetical protein [Microbacteriaceae bacterium]